ncbi:hypothetical protein FD688_05735 [Apilactobacillus kunkeei]|uniref:hypothetical protein n=1 Tax=Apilactobacillus kunkeei TaxID=148814 RepID=UPI00110CF578|nr:hypothetical protein [Apilactobacillus kunkeei]TMS99574.1 hypothetical protein FD688_05735 [Apilactobacillus kunkeei]
MKKKCAAAFAAVGAVFLIGTTVHASAKQTYTNRSEFVNVYKYGKLRHGRHTMMRYRYFKRIGHMHVGNRVRFKGSNFLFLPKLGGYVPEYQLKLVKPVKKFKKAKRVVVKPKKTTIKKKKDTKEVKKTVITNTSASGMSLSNRMFNTQPKPNVSTGEQKLTKIAVKPIKDMVNHTDSKHPIIDDKKAFNQPSDNNSMVTKIVNTDGSGAALSNSKPASDINSSVSDVATTTFSTASTTSTNK